MGELLCVMHSCTVVPRRQVWYASVALLQRHGLLPRDRNYLQAIEKNEFHLSPVVEVTVPQNIMVFHQLRAGEIATLFRTLETHTAWAATLQSSGLSAGVLLEAMGSGRGGALVVQRGTPPFVML